MKKIAIALICAAGVCALSACTGNTGYTKVSAADGTTVVHGHVDKGTTVTSDGNGAFTIDANKGPEQQNQISADTTSK